MSTAQPAPLPHQQPPLFGQRTYTVPSTVHTNLPRQGYDGEPGSWDRARGLLVELCRQLSATPLALYHQPLYTPNGNPGGLVVTAIIRRQHNQITTVVLRQQDQAQNGQRRRDWQLTADGVAVPGGSGHVLASPPLLAQYVTDAVDL